MGRTTDHRIGPFGRGVRLTSSQMEEVFSEGKKLVRGDFVFWAKKRAEDCGGARLGIAVSRRLGPAVRRNRIKRLVRESFRLNRGRFAPDTDLIVYPRPGLRWKALREAEAAFLSALGKAGLIQ